MSCLFFGFGANTVNAFWLSHKNRKVSVIKSNYLSEQNNALMDFLWQLTTQFTADAWIKTWSTICFHWHCPTCGFQKARANMFLALVVPSVHVSQVLTSLKSRPVSPVLLYCFSPLLWVCIRCHGCILGSLMLCFCGDRHLWFWLQVWFQLYWLSCLHA